MKIVSAENSLVGAGVSGTVSTDFLAAWLADGRSGYPAHTDGDLSLTATPLATILVDTVAVVNHNIIPGASITLGGSLSSTIDTQPWLANGMPANWYRRLTSPVSTSSIVLGVSGNGGPVIVGELYAGLAQEFPALHLGRRRSPDKPFPWEGEFSSLAPYDNGVAPSERVGGTMVLDEPQMNALHACFLSQFNGSRPVLILPDHPSNVAWLAQFNYAADDLAPGAPLVDGSPADDLPALFTVSVEIVTIPSLRW